MSTLHGLAVGAVARICEVAEQPLRVRMTAMGLRPGAEVAMVAHGARGSRLVRVGDARLALAREVALSIEVEATRVQ
ncbi:MAG: FeoA family protein [Candidatus Nanopelagicales bacterium]